MYVAEVLSLKCHMFSSAFITAFSLVPVSPICYAYNRKPRWRLETRGSRLLEMIICFDLLQEVDQYASLCMGVCASVKESGGGDRIPHVVLLRCAPWGCCEFSTAPPFARQICWRKNQLFSSRLGVSANKTSSGPDQVGFLEMTQIPAFKCYQVECKTAQATFTQSIQSTIRGSRRKGSFCFCTS